MPAESITETIATKQVEMVASVVRPQSALFAGNLTLLLARCKRCPTRSTLISKSSDETG
jgi:hypothetical protein